MVWAGLVLAIRNHRGIIDTLLHLTRVSMEPMGRNEPSSSVLVFFSSPPLLSMMGFWAPAGWGFTALRRLLSGCCRGPPPQGAKLVFLIVGMKERKKCFRDAWLMIMLSA